MASFPRSEVTYARIAETNDNTIYNNEHKLIYFCNAFVIACIYYTIVYVCDFYHFVHQTVRRDYAKGKIFGKTHIE